MSPPRMWFVDGVDTFNFAIWLGDESGATTKLNLPSNIWMLPHRDWLAIKPRESWSVAGQTYAADTVLVISLAAFLEGNCQFEVLFEPSPRRALQGFFWSAGKLVLSILNELRPLFEICTPSEKGWSRAQLRGFPDIGSSTSGPLIAIHPKATATCSSGARIRSRQLRLC